MAVKLRISPLEVPAELVATTWKKYSVSGDRLVNEAETATPIVPATISCSPIEVGEARPGSVPYSKWTVVASSFGLTVPLRMALLLVIDVAAAVVTAGGEFVVGGGVELESLLPPHE